MRALQYAPTVVLTAQAGGRLVVHLFPRVLPDIPDVQVAGLPVEGETPRVAQPQRPNLGPVADGLSIWIGRGNGVRHRISGLDVETQEFAQQDVGVLGVVGYVAAASAIPGASVQISVVRAEGELAAVVVRLAGMRDGEQNLLRSVVRHIGVAHADLIAGDDQAAGVVDVVDVEVILAHAVAGWKRDAEQALLGAGVLNYGGDVEERRP